jgi:hypothetical protein
VRPAFSWKQVGTYLLSERTLNALLGLAAFLILASAVVISTLNPTHLQPLAHLGAMAITTLAFFGAGCGVRQKLALTKTGSALLAIGAGFIPLDIWTLGQEQLPRWDHGTVWLVASTLCLPIYLVSHAALRDRTFALLTALAGGSELLAVLHRLGVPLEWGCCTLVALAMGYVLLARRVQGGSAPLAWALFWTARAATPLVMVGLMVATLFPALWDMVVATPVGGVSVYAVGGAWWLGTAFYALCARLFPRRHFHAVTAWTLPLAYLFTLTKAPWDASWYNLFLALLAAGYLGYGRWALRLPAGDAHPNFGQVLRQPVYQVGLVLTLVAGLWPIPSLQSQLATLGVLALTYAAAAFLLRQRACAYVAVALVPVAAALTFQLLALAADVQALLWVVVAAALLAAGEGVARRSGEAYRPLAETALGQGVWRSRFASPLFLVGYAVTLLAIVGLVQVQYPTAPLVAGVPVPGAPVILAALAIVTICALSAATRRSGFFLYPATWLLLLPVISLTGLLAHRLGLTPSAAEWMRVPAAVGVGYMALAWALDRLGRRYGQPIYLAGYALLLGAMVLSVPDRAITVQVMGVNLLVYAWSAWLVHRGRHPSFIWVVGCLFGEPASRAFRTARTLFLYLVAWLFPVWLLLALSLWQSRTPGYEGVGVVLAALAPCYAALALWFGRIAREYRLPWYIGGYALSALGPVVAAPDPAWRAVALAISIALYSASAMVSRRSAWLSLVALLTPVLLGEVLPDLGIGHGFYGLASIGLGLGYDCVSLALQRRGPRRIFHPLGRGVGAYALPFVATSHGLSVLGLALVSTQDRTLALLGFALAALHYVGSAVAFRESLFSYPIVVTTSVAYVVGMTMLPLDQRYLGLALLPGIVAYLIVAEVLRRRLDAPQRAAARSPWDGLTPAAGAIDRRSIGFLLTSWATPFYAVLYAATGAVAAYSSSEPWLWALAWWSIAAVYGVSARLFRHPAWLYPATGAALLAYVATAYAVVPTLSFADAMVTLVPPTWLLFGLAHAVGRRGHAATAPAPRHPWLAGWAWTHPWARPLIVSGVVALVISTAGSAPDAAAGLWTAGAFVVLATVLAVLWRSEGAARASLALAGVIVQEGLRLAGVPMLEQPPCWAALALIAGVLSFIIPSRRRAALRLWQRPLYLGSIATSVLALAMATDLAAELMSQAALGALAATTAVAGLTSIGHGFHRRERLLGYLGVALLEVGYMLQLALVDVGQPQAFTLPAGLYLLAIAYLEWRRGSGARIKALLEVAGLMLVLGTALAQAAGVLDAGAGRYVYDVVLLFESLALFALGAVLRWRKTFFVSILALVADVFIVLADPIRAVNTWYLLALVGFTMLGVVVFIEQRRQRIPVWVNDWRLRLEAWD